MYIVLSYCSSILPVVVIGFRQTMYAERESAGQVQLEVAVLMGQLAKPVTVLLSTSDGTASGLQTLVQTNIHSIHSSSPHNSP